MSKPTPGPWEAYHDKYYDTWSVEGGGDIVADIWRLAEETHNRHPHFEDDCEANARLIAASPDLLEACEALLPIVVDAIMHGMPVTKEVAHARNIAVAAIAKAKGPQ